MKRKLCLITAAAMLFGAAAVIPANADGEETVPDKVLDCGDYEVEVDGVIDDVYHQSYSIKHEWADSHWCGGKYDAIILVMRGMRHIINLMDWNLSILLMIMKTA